MLTSQKFEISFLLGFPLSSGITREAILELIHLVKSRVKKFTATFISLGGIVSIPVAFLEFSLCIIFFNSILFTR